MWHSSADPVRPGERAGFIRNGTGLTASARPRAAVMTLLDVALEPSCDHVRYTLRARGRDGWLDPRACTDGGGRRRHPGRPRSRRWSSLCFRTRWTYTRSIDGTVTGSPSPPLCSQLHPRWCRSRPSLGPGTPGRRTQSLLGHRAVAEARLAHRRVWRTAARPRPAPLSQQPETPALCHEPLGRLAGAA